MANRVLAGNRSTGGFGIYVSRPGHNVLTAASDKLMLNTNSGETGSNFFSAGHFQVVPVSGGVGSTAPVTFSSSTVSAGATATPTYQSIASTRIMVWGISDSLASGNTNAGSYTYSSLGASSVTLTNNAGQSRVIKNVTFNLLSTSALF
tara:strand:- start:264 stop:710 length:447 start_codon:yes stop_codon:yes gene_type:complete